VVSCYEAGRDAFWLHRYLLSTGVENAVVDSSSIEVNRRYRRAKTDQLDLAKLLTMLIRYHVGEKKVWRVVRAPSLEEEDNRQLHRELETLKAEHTQHINRLKGLLAGQGVRMEIRDDFLPRLESLRLWDGSALPPGLLGRLEREHQRLQFANAQIKQLERERVEVLRHSQRTDVAQVRQLLHLNGIGINSAWLYVMEFFAWRRFRNRRQVGALSGLTPTPRQSGDESRELGTLAPALQVQVSASRVIVMCGRWRSRSPAVSHRRAAGSRGTNGGAGYAINPRAP